MGISIWQLAIILVIVLLLFGTKKLRSIGSDLGGAVKGFRGAMDKVEAQKDGAADEVDGIGHANSESSTDSISGSVIEGEVTQEKEKEKEKEKV